VFAVRVRVRVHVHVHVHVRVHVHLPAHMPHSTHLPKAKIRAECAAGFRKRPAVPLLQGFARRPGSAASEDIQRKAWRSAGPTVPD